MTLKAVTKLKVGYVFAILLINFAGMLPIRWKVFRANATFLSILNCFAGGVFLAMAFVHILPESVNTYNNVIYKSRGLPPVGDDRRRLGADTNSTSGDSSAYPCEVNYPTLFPIPYVLFLTGYALVLLVDRIMKGGDHDHSHGEGEDGHDHFPDLDEFEHDEDGHDHKHGHEHSHDHSHAGHSHVHHHGSHNGHRHDHRSND